MKEYIIHAPKGLGAYEEEYISSFGKPIERITRCKDCYFYGTFQRKHYCTKYEHSVKADGFCAWAERKANDDNS